MTSASGETVNISSSNVGLIPWGGGGKANTSMDVTATKDGEVTSAGVVEATFAGGWETNSTEGRKTSSTGQKSHHNLRAQFPSFIRFFPSKPTWYHSFPVDTLTLTVDTLWVWEFKLLCKLVNCKISYYVWLSAVSSLWLQNIRLCSEHT